MTRLLVRDEENEGQRWFERRPATFIADLELPCATCGAHSGTCCYRLGAYQAKPHQTRSSRAKCISDDWEDCPNLFADLEWSASDQFEWPDAFHCGLRLNEWPDGFNEILVDGRPDPNDSRAYEGGGS